MAESREADRDRPGVIAPPPLIFLGGIVAGEVLGRVFPAPALPAGTRLAGKALIVAALVLMLLAFREFRRARTSFHPGEPDTSVVTTGPFRFTRNPLYIGLTAIAAGVGLAKDEPWYLIVLVPVLVVLHWGVILREERYLERKFAAAYTDYKARVRRWF